MLQYCKPKEQIVLIKKFGLWDWQELALQTIWNEYGLTRERIRQIENQGLMRFRRLIFWNEKYLKVIEEAKKIIDSHNWLLDESSLMSKLINKNFSKLSAQELKLVLDAVKQSSTLQQLSFFGIYIIYIYVDMPQI